MLYATVEGADKILKTLRGLDGAARRVFKAKVRADVRCQANQMKATAKAGAPKRTGRLRRAIKVRVRTLGLSFMAHLFINFGKTYDDTAGAWYGSHINGGYTKANGTYVPGAHFMEKAHDRHAKTAARAVGLTISTAVDAAAKAG